MTISELIERLEALKAEHGDLDVMPHSDAGYCVIVRVEAKTWFIPAFIGIDWD